MNKLSAIYKLRFIATRHDKTFLLILLVMSIFLSIIETVGISAIMPFITLATTPEIIDSDFRVSRIYTYLENSLGLSSHSHFVALFGAVLIGFYIFRAFYSMFYIYLLNRFASGRFHIFAYKLFRNYTNLPYKKFVKKNSAEMVKTIVNESQNLSTYIQNLLWMLSEIFTITLLYIILLFVNWKMTLILTLFLGLKVMFLIVGLKKTIKNQGVKRAQFQSRFYKVLNETFGNFKMIKLIQNESKIFKEFEKTSSGFARANIINGTLAQLPRISLETIGFGVLISVVIYVLLVYDDASFVLPIISMYALALYRMLPAVNRILSSYNQMLFLSKSLDIVYDELSYTPPTEGTGAIEFRDKIVLKNISFGYIDGKKVLENINLTIKKGEKLAFIGESGSGKSTLIDIISGLYRPNSGTIEVDGIELQRENIRAYRSKIGYIPQSIYLFDGTVGENVAFGYEYDEARVIEVLKQANIYQFLSTKEGIDTLVGDGGIQLSGGQKQRIGIARALYNNPEILVLDEATSALDDDTESKIMDEIYSISGDKTLLIIAHRLSSLNGCDRHVRLDGGIIVK